MTNSPPATQDVVDAPRLGKQFLVDLFGEEWTRVAVCDVPGDPNESRAWQISWAENGLRRCGAGTNNYFSVSVLSEPRRVRASFEKTRVLVFDDVGTKVDPVRLFAEFGPPRWRVETSGGNFQWVYRLDRWINDPLLYEGLTRALAARGLTDPGAIDRVRLMRLPTGINGKKKYAAGDGRAWAVRGACDPGAGELALDEVLAALGLTVDTAIDLGRTGGGSGSGVGTGDAGLAAGWVDDPSGATDPLLGLMHDLGMVLGTSPKPGVLDIRCPWSSQHTSRELSGTAYFGRGLFKCQHGHCMDKRSGDFRAEILHQAEEALGAGLFTGSMLLARKAWAGEGPPDRTGLAPLVALAARMASEGWRENEGERENEDERNKAEVWARVLNTWVYAREQDRFVSLAHGEMLTGLAFEALVAETGAIPAGVPRRKSAMVRAKNEGRQVARVSYMPGAARLVQDEKGRGQVLNTWRAPQVAGLGNPGSVGPEDVRPWLDHLAYLFPDVRVQNTLLDYMAHALQKPGEKVNFAVVVVGVEQGTGKDSLFVPLWHGLGEENVAFISPDHLAGRFNPWLVTQMVVVEEMSAFDKRQIYDRVKPLLVAPPQHVVVEQKYMAPMTIPNQQLWLFFTNHEDAFALENSDRRFWIIQTFASPREADYYQTLWGWYEQGGGLAKVIRFLLDRKISAAFRADRTPEDFQKLKPGMAVAGAPAAVRWIIEQFEDGGLLEGRRIVSAREIVDLACTRACPVAVQRSMTDKQAVAALRLMGWVRLGTDTEGRVRVEAQSGEDGKVRLKDGRRVKLWAAGAKELLAQLNGDQLRARYERERDMTRARSLGEKWIDDGQ